jgi:hypothetical protein
MNNRGIGGNWHDIINQMMLAADAERSRAMKEIMRDLQPSSAPGTTIIMESTARGADSFWLKQYTDAELREQSWRATCAMFGADPDTNRPWYETVDNIEEFMSTNASTALLKADRMLQFFEYKHLPEHLQAVSQPFHVLAHHIVETLPSNPERTAGLRKLVEAKDCAVRALIFQD